MRELPRCHYQVSSDPAAWFSKKAASVTRPVNPLCYGSEGGIGEAMYASLEPARLRFMYQINVCIDPTGLLTEPIPLPDLRSKSIYRIKTNSLHSMPNPPKAPESFHGPKLCTASSTSTIWRPIRDPRVARPLPRTHTGPCLHVLLHLIFCFAGIL